MEQRTFGPTGARVPVVGQGTWNLERDDRRSAIEALRRGLDAGMSHVDTAEMYGDGRVEELVREALGDRRDELFLVSKVLPENASRRGTVEACRRSLERLGTDRLDCYLLHWKGRHPLAGTLAAFAELRAEGRIRAWGVSNFGEEDLAEAVALAGERSVGCNQVLYHLGERGIEHAVLPFCREHGIAVVAYSPLGAGRFPSPQSPGGKVLAAVAAAHGATPHQVALAFLTRDPIVFAIPKAARADHALANAAAGDLRLAEAELERIALAFPRGPRRRGVATL